MKKALFLFFSVLLILFVSCKNFMNGSDVQDELTKMIDVANAKDYTIIVAQNEAMGSFLSYGDKNCKIGYSIDLQFTVDSENYIYKGLKVVSKDNPENSREDCVELTEVSTAAEKKNGIHKVQVKLIKEANDIMIQPDCILIPKIVNITPVNMPTSYDQDTPIEITFNKSLNSESFGNYSCISIYSNEIDLKEYFEEPSFSTNNTKLLIVPKQDRHIITPDSGKIMTVTVELNFKNEKDTDGMLLNDNKIYTYKINETFGNQEISTILVREDEDSKSGKFDKTGEIKCTVGYSFDLQFTLKKAAYVFNGLEAVSKTNAETFNPDIVEFETIKSDDDLGIFTIQVKIKEQSNDILIKPKCILIPKITKITPDYVTSGCYQDETITIEFNKSVDPETFGNFECISISSGDEELTTAYFDTPVFFDEYKLLKISPKAKLLPPDSNKRKDINIRIDFTNLKDVDGLSIESYPTYSYRVNDNFNNQEISEISVETDTNNNTGTFDKSGQIKCTVGYDVNLQFKVNKSLYVFKGLKVDRRNTSQAYNPDDISITYKGDESTGIYDITVHMNKKTENIKLSPDCKLIPRVTQITPNYSSTGCEQDSTIEITFNKAVDRTSFGSFDCIDIYSDGDDIKSEYFNTPVFNDENTVLKITPKKLIIQPDSGKKKDINVKINFTDLKDVDGLSIESYPAYSYRINDTFSNQEISEIAIEPDANNSTGTFDKTGQIKCTVGYDVKLQFKLNKSLYVFTGLKVDRRNTSQAYNPDDVTISYEGDESTGIYDITVHVNNKTENIKLSPDCKLIPKIEQIKPAYTSIGCEQDSTIEIKFNKAVDVTSFGDFSCIDIYSEGDDLKSEYYNTPVFNENKTVLKITSKKLILQPDSGKKKDINVRIDFTDLKDCDGLSIEYYPTYSYRINDTFNNQKKSKILIQNPTNTAEGSFDKTGEIECSVGYDINLQFKLNKADYIFEGLNIESRNTTQTFNANAVTITSNGDSDTGIYTIAVHVSQETENIKISPNCKLIPRVSQITPAYTSTGCEQDSTIQITFNKAVDATSFGDFSCIDIYSEGDNLKSEYYNTPVFNENNTVLKITSKKLILQPDSGKKKDIYVKIDFTNLKDCDGLSIEPIAAYSFRINDSFEGQEKSKILIKEDTNSITGTFDRTGEIECTVGYDINLQFNVNKTDYVFRGLKVESRTSSKPFNSNDVEIVSITGDKNTGLYTIIVHVNAETDNIQLSPDCVLLPKVSSVTPSYESTGCEQDSTITVTFNKPIEITEFFSPTITDSSGNNLAEYFDKPYLSDESDILYIPTIKTKRLINTNGSSETKDIILKIDLSNIKDEDNNFGSGIFQHKYRVNKTLDSVPPIFTGVTLYSTSDKTSRYYKKLSNKDFNNGEWNSTGTGYGDYGTNHVANSIYVEAEGYDADSGIAGFSVKEKLIKYTDGTSANFEEQYSIDCEENTATDKHAASFDLKSTYDGIIELEFFLVDSAGNISNESKKCYVVKDTKIDSAYINFNEEIGQFPDTYAGWAAAIPIIEGDTQDVSITLTNTAKDYWYSGANCASDYEIQAYWGYSDDEITNPVTKTGKTFSFTRDVKNLVYIKLICKDELGNEKEIIKRMDPRPELALSEGQLTIANKEMLFIKNNLLHLLAQSGSGSIAQYSSFKYVFYDDENNPSEIILSKTNQPYFNINEETARAWVSLNKDGDYLGRVDIYISTTIGDFPSPLSVNYCTDTITQFTREGSWSYVEFGQNTRELSSGNEQNNRYIDSFGPEGNPYLKETVKINTETKTGCYKVTISDYMTEAGKNSNLTYNFYAIPFEGKDYTGQEDVSEDDLNAVPFDEYMIIKSTSPEMFLPSNTKYIFYITVSDADTLYAPYDNPILSGDRVLDKRDNPGFQFQLNGETTLNKILTLSEDLTAPYLIWDDNFNEKTHMFNTAGGFIINIPADAGNTAYNSGNNDSFYKNKAGNYEFTYYILPNIADSINQVPTYTVSELENKYSAFAKTYEYKPDPYGINSNKLTIPYGNLQEGYYTISIVLKDKYGNASVYTYPFVYKMLGNLPYTKQFGYEDLSSTQREYWYDFTIHDDNTAHPEIKIKTVDGKTISTINAKLDYCYDDGYNCIWNEQDDLCNTIGANPQPSFEHRISLGANGNIIMGNWHRLRAFYGFDDSSSVTGKGFYNTEYIYLSYDLNNNISDEGWFTCKLKNCFDGLNGVQIFTDNDVLVHTMYSSEKLTESRLDKDAAAIWETRGIETGLKVYKRKLPQPSYDQYGQQAGLADKTDTINVNYDLANLDKIPSGYWYTTIIHFVDGTTLMTDIKQK